MDFRNPVKEDLIVRNMGIRYIYICSYRWMLCIYKTLWTWSYSYSKI